VAENNGSVRSGPLDSGLELTALISVCGRSDVSEIIQRDRVRLLAMPVHRARAGRHVPLRCTENRLMLIETASCARQERSVSRQCLGGADLRLTSTHETALVQFLWATVDDPILRMTLNAAAHWWCCSSSRVLLTGAAGAMWSCCCALVLLTAATAAHSGASAAHIDAAHTDDALRCCCCCSQGMCCSVLLTGNDAAHWCCTSHWCCSLAVLVYWW
jgi:hypothetical protein